MSNLWEKSSLCWQKCMRTTILQLEFQWKCICLFFSTRSFPFSVCNKNKKAKKNKNKINNWMSMWKTVIVCINSLLCLRKWRSLNGMLKAFHFKYVSVRAKWCCRYFSVSAVLNESTCFIHVTNDYFISLFMQSLYATESIEASTATSCNVINATKINWNGGVNVPLIIYFDLGCKSVSQIGRMKFQSDRMSKCKYIGWPLTMISGKSINIPILLLFWCPLPFCFVPTPTPIHTQYTTNNNNRNKKKH